MKDFLCINFLHLIQVANQGEMIAIFMKYHSTSVYLFRNNFQMCVCVYMHVPRVYFALQKLL